MKADRWLNLRRSLRLLGPVLILSSLGMGQAPPQSAKTSASGEHAFVREVVDGDTVRLSDGTLVRYIGMDTPEMRHRQGNRWVRDPEPLAGSAMEANRRLVEGRQVDLETDLVRRDRYGRLLAYVYVDGVMVNERLLKEGLAKLMTIPPNVKYIDRLRAAQEEARAARRGLWASPGALE